MEKIAISASDQSLEANVDPHFGRASYFLLINPETTDYEVVANRSNLKAAQEANIQAATLVAGYKPAALLTGYCGPKAYRTLMSAGIPVLLGVKGQIIEAVQQYRTGQLTPVRGPNALGHWGER
ncbi:MAG: NifB/NifX family molybdenum-iron cluster-binding protein [Desulfobaccales bacterium]